MSYEIPQSLQYKEKIVFNLTLEQFLYAVVFGSLSFFVYSKSFFDFYVRIFLVSLLVSFGLLFMFFGLFELVRDFLLWCVFRKVNICQKAMKKFLGVTAIEDSCYFVKDKSVALLKVEPLNFKIKTLDDRDIIIHSFQKFLNALDFKIQILMFTNDVNIDSYFTDLEPKIKKSSIYEEVFLAHKNNLNKLMLEKVVSNRQFVIAIQENSLGLDGQLLIVQDFLKSIGLKCRRLNTVELINLLSKLFNKIPEKSVYWRTTPEEIVNKPDYIKIDNYYCRIISAVGYPRIVEEGFLDKIIRSIGNFDLSIHIEPFPIENTLVMLNKELQKQRADLFASEMKNTVHPSLEIQFRDTRNVLEAIQKGEEKLFNVSLYINVRAKDLKELDLQTKVIESKLNSILILPKVARYRMSFGLKSVLPFASNELGIRRNITTNALSAFFPFTSPFLMLEKGGVFLGLNKNQLPIIKDVFSLANANGAILATSGSGKSYTAKLIISRYLLNGTKVIVIDPQNEYTKLAEKFGGSVITISKDSDTIINPLDLLEHSYENKRLALMDLFGIIFPEMTEMQRAVLDQAISKTYDRKGINQNSYDDKVPPILEDLYFELEKMSKDTSVYERGAYIALLNRLSMYVSGVFGFINKQTKINVDNDFVTFNLGSIPKQVKPVMMFLILDYVYTRMKEDREPKLLVVDEAWSLLQNSSEEGYIFEIVKTCRKFNMGLLLITQDVEDLLNSKAGRAVLANSSYNILLRQKPAVIHSLQQVFNLSGAEREHLLMANVGQGLLFMDNDHQEITFVASPEEHAIITTKPDEIKKEKKKVEKKDITIELDLSEGFYAKSELSPEEIAYLVKNGFKDEKHVPLDASGPKEYLVKSCGNTTSEHTFVLHSIKKLLLKYTDKVKVDESSRKESINPDIVFTNEKGEEVAVEVETGVNLKNNKEYFDRKVKLLDERFPNNWYMVLTNAQWYERYANAFGNHVILRHKVISFIDKQFQSGPRARDNITASTLTNFSDDKN